MCFSHFVCNHLANKQPRAEPMSIFFRRQEKKYFRISIVKTHLHLFVKITEIYHILSCIDGIIHFNGSCVFKKMPMNEEIHQNFESYRQREEEVSFHTIRLFDFPTAKIRIADMGVRAIASLGWLLRSTFCIRCFLGIFGFWSREPCSDVGPN